MEELPLFRWKLNLKMDTLYYPEIYFLDISLFYITILSFLFFPTLSIYVNIFLLLRPLQEKLHHHYKHLVP